MNLTSITNLYRSQQSAATNTSIQTDPVQKALATATSNLSRQQAATSASLSSVGQLKSAFSRVADSGAALAATKTDTTNSSLKSNLASFVSAYNDTLSAGSKVAPGTASTAVNSLRRALGSDSGRSDLRSLGITQKSDGSLVLNSKALDTALQDNGAGVRAAAARIGSTADKQADRALSDSGGVGVSYNRLSAAAKSQAARQTELSNLASAQAGLSTSASSQNGINSYLQVLSL
ncbi:hypothetical protein DLREEDagrD3_12590 [Denitratisoma sp. agr-D3]